MKSGQDKIGQICESLRTQTLEPAMKKAEEIILEAEKLAEQKRQAAEKEAEEIVQKAKEHVEQQNKLFQASLAQGSKLALETLRQYIQNHFFNSHLDHLIAQETVQPNVIGRLIEALIKSVEKEGLSANLQAQIAKTASPHEVNSFLTKDTLEKLEGKSVQLGPFKGGAKLKVGSKKMAIDMSDEALKELLASFISKDFRNFIFK